MQSSITDHLIYCRRQRSGSQSESTHHSMSNSTGASNDEVYRAYSGDPFMVSVFCGAAFCGLHFISYSFFGSLQGR